VSQYLIAVVLQSQRVNPVSNRRFLALRAKRNRTFIICVYRWVTTCISYLIGYAICMSLIIIWSRCKKRRKRDLVNASRCNVFGVLESCLNEAGETKYHACMDHIKSSFLGSGSFGLAPFISLSLLHIIRLLFV
jgi:hypothetical protein